LNYKIPGSLAVIAGILAIISQWTSSTSLFEFLFRLISVFTPRIALLLGWVLVVLDFLAAFGGIFLIIGGILIFANKGFWGKLLIGFVIGNTLIGFILSILVAAIGGVLIDALVALLYIFVTLNGVVFILSVVALFIPITKEKM
jgi:hypothetical protein